MTFVRSCAGMAVALVIACAGSPAVAGEALETKAVAASVVWLALIDDGRYGEGWDHAAQYLKSVVDRRQLVAALSAVRKPLGRVISRKLRSKKYMTSLPGVPDGDYVVIQYATAFEKKRSAVETITPVLESDGTMKVSGYYIR